MDGLTKRYRSERLIELGKQLKRDYYIMFIGKNKEVLFEMLAGKITGYIEGYTDNYLKVLAPSDDIKEGELAMVRLKGLKQNYILAEKIFQ